MATETYKKTGIPIDSDTFLKKRLSSLLSAALHLKAINDKIVTTGRNIIVAKEEDRLSDAGNEWICSIFTGDKLDTTYDVPCRIATDKDVKELGYLNSKRTQEFDFSYLELNNNKDTYKEIILNLFRLLQYNVFELEVTGKGNNQRLTTATKGIQIDKIKNNRDSVGNEKIEKVSVATKDTVYIDNIYIQSLLKDDIINNIYTAPIVCSYIKEKDL